MKRFSGFFGLLALLVSACVVHAQVHAPASGSAFTLLPHTSMTRTAPNRTASPLGLVYFPDTLVLKSSTSTIRISASYNQKGWMTRRLVELWSAGQWANYVLDSWIFSGPNNDNIDVEQVWAGGQWVNSTLDSSTYDARGNMLVHLYEYWTKGKWQDSILSSRTYDANGGMLTDWSKLWQNGQWVNSNQEAYTNDANGNDLTYLNQNWSNGQWQNSDYWTYTYDGNNDVMTWTRQEWQSGGGPWVNSALITYTYVAAGKPGLVFAQTWSGGQWANAGQTTYTYDGSGNLLSEVGQSWSNGTWVNYGKDSYTYDAGGNALTHLYQTWSNGQWTNWTMGTFTYDSHGNTLSGVNAGWSNSAWAPADGQFIIFFVSDGGYSYFKGDTISISYTLLNVTGVPAAAGDRVTEYALSQNYPNPFNPGTTISYALPKASHVTLALYNALGQLVSTLVNRSEEPGLHEVKVDGSGLASGVYIYRIQAGSFVQSKKLILLK